MKWETVIGLEVHAELSTRSKLFCGCSAAFGGEPNSRVCPVCSGMPGTLPKLNRAAVAYAVRLGFALDCEISRDCKFDRKNYFYPDLPKAYQISQLYTPICRNGKLKIPSGGFDKTIRIREIHIEEDAGKLIHDSRTGKTLMDFNRCGVPLLEIVSMPDFRCAAEAVAYLEKLRETLLYLGICDCKMQEGSLRADVNLSVREPGGALGVRTEMKNLNSFKAVGRAVEYESARQSKLLESGGRVTQETRRWDDDKGVSYGLRSKENTQDYRYFPEPDLLPVRIDEQWLSQIRASLPEFAHQKRERYVRDFGLSEAEVSLLTADTNLSGLFDETANLCGNPTEAAHLVTGEILRLMNVTNVTDLQIDAGKLAALVTLVTEGKISRNAYKDAVAAVFSHNIDPMVYIAENNLLMRDDSEAVTEAAETVLRNNPGAVSDYRAGKEKSFGFLMGQVMRALGKLANPETVRKKLKEMLEGWGEKQK